MLHPFTYSIINYSKYLTEAEKILFLDNPFLKYSSLKKYLLFMNIRQIELSTILKEYFFEKNITLIIDYLQKKGQIELSTKQKEALISIHQLLEKKKSFAYLSLKEKTIKNQDLTLLHKNQKILEKCLPLNIKILGFHNSNTEGIIYENSIRQRYEELGYEVISNLLISCGSQLFELDNLAIQKNEIIVISCKDHSRYHFYDILVNHIRNYANILEMINHLLRMKKAILHVKVQENFVSKLKEKYEGENWAERIQIKIN